MQVFDFEDQPVRTLLDEDGDPWWVAADVCRVLTIAHSASSLRTLDDDEKGVHTMHTLGGAQEMTVVNEPGLYSLILVSRKPEAKRFKRWITRASPAFFLPGGFDPRAIFSRSQTRQRPGTPPGTPSTVEGRGGGGHHPPPPVPIGGRAPQGRGNSRAGRLTPGSVEGRRDDPVEPVPGRHHGLEAGQLGRHRAADDDGGAVEVPRRQGPDDGADLVGLGGGVAAE